MSISNYYCSYEYLNLIFCIFISRLEYEFCDARVMKNSILMLCIKLQNAAKKLLVFPY